ncbi:MAG: OmpA family protein [Leptospiraceae bacterium]|nr:OmpA family protein [Leptospiraceae bacterium]
MKTRIAILFSLIFLALSVPVIGDPVQISRTPSLTNPPRGLLEQESTQSFRFLLEKGDVLTVDKIQDILLSRNQSTGSREERNKIILKVTENEAAENPAQALAIMQGEFHTYARTPAGAGPFRKETSYNSRFTISKLGQYDVPDQFIMPNLRSLPNFPVEEVKKGQTWIAPGMETMDLQGQKIKIPLAVKYRYMGEGWIVDRDGKQRKAHKILFAYEFSHPVNRPGFPLRKIVGVSRDELWFDAENGLPIYDVQDLQYRFYSVGQTVEGIYRIHSWYDKSRTVSDDQKEQMADDIRKDLKDGPADDVNVRKTEDGIALDLSDILFEFDSADLTPRARETINRISKILKKYPDREIRISGHTDSTGPDQYNLKLSELRARSVLNELQKNHSFDATRMSYKGYGETRPIAPNDNPEGRARNRRVEILIVTE